MSRQEPPDWLLERYRLGEVTADERARVDRAMAADPQAMTARLAALEADDAQVLAAHPPARFAASVKAQATAPVADRRWMFPVIALTAVAALAVVVWPRVTTDEDVLREKGGAATLSLFRMTSQGPQPLVDGARVQSGEIVQARYRVDQPGHAVVLSFDALGQVTVHSPAIGNDTRADAGAFVTERSFELDASPGFERFVLVTSSEPLSLEELTHAAQAVAKAADPQHAPLPVSKNTHVRSVVLVKESP